ncbi:MAG: hypothetical protein M0R75_14020 [Dehalococcoidia bacterium]|nr:hypothetical protein [Dehalococcoidia bacterium]
MATTTIAVLRVPADPARDPLDPKPPAAVIACGVPAHISTSRGSEEVSSGGSQEVVYFRMSCAVTDLRSTDQVRDEVTGEVYEVTWARERRGLGLDHTQAGLKQVAGVVSEPRFTSR